MESENVSAARPAPNPAETQSLKRNPASVSGILISLNVVALVKASGLSFNTFLLESRFKSLSCISTAYVIAADLDVQKPVGVPHLFFFSARIGSWKQLM